MGDSLDNNKIVRTPAADRKIGCLCRICLITVKEAVNLFNEDEISRNILDILLKCFQIVLPNDKGLPSVICENCIEELNVANNFRMKCVTFDERFSSILKGSPNKHKEELADDVEDNHCLELSNSMSSHNPDTPQGMNPKLESNMLDIEQQLKKKPSHISKVTGFGSNRRYHCTKCSYSTPHSQTLVNHMRRHNGDRPYQCECGKAFTQSSSLNAHKKIHNTTKYYMCSVCGKQFKHAFTLKKHSRVHETAQFCCNICNKKLKSQESLQDHMHRHYNIRNFNCEDCGDTFVTSSELLNHRKKHNTVKKVECHLCGYKTHTKKNLIVHLKRHAGDKSYKCEICKEAFYSSGDVHRHQRVHTREKPFSCPLCVQRFTYSTSLNKHMLTVHNINYKWADFKWKESRQPKKLIEIKQ